MKVLILAASYIAQRVTVEQ